jgi:hypothetical protein
MNVKNDDVLDFSAEYPTNFSKCTDISLWQRNDLEDRLPLRNLPSSAQMSHLRPKRRPLQRRLRLPVPPQHRPSALDVPEPARRGRRDLLQRGRLGRDDGAAHGIGLLELAVRFGCH